jgi:Ca2+-transporting ATPase
MSAAAETTARILPIHAEVPGRARLRVAGLRGSHPLKRMIETRLPEESAIRWAEANTITGNVLVLFDRSLPLTTVVVQLERVLSGHRDDKAGRRAAAHDTPNRSLRWHSLPAQDVLDALDSTQRGLSTEAAQKRGAEHGPNTLPRIGGRSRLSIFLEQFQSMPVLLLGGAAILSLATGGLLDAAVTLGVVALNAAIGFGTEQRTERILGSLRLPMQRIAPVRRDGRVKRIAIAGIVPGDLLILRPGGIVPADARIVAAEALSVDESVLTGESLPVLKAVASVGCETTLPERRSMVYRGTTVVGGSGFAVAVATGMRTEAGQIQILIGAAHAPATPMQRQLGTLGRQLVALCGAVCGAVFLIGLLRGQSILQMLKTSIALAVAAVPEGLPTVGTTALALGIEEMRRHKLLVRSLSAIETLASVSVISFDKTGTLTQNRMSVAALVCGEQSYHVVGSTIRRGQAGIRALAKEPELTRVLEIGALCSEVRIVQRRGAMVVKGSPTESALIRLGIDSGLDIRELRRKFLLRATEYRSEDRQYMATLHQKTGGKRFVAVKGNPEQVLAGCGWQQRRQWRVRLNKRARDRIAAENRRMAEIGLRVLGLAYAEAELAEGSGSAIGALVQERGLVWVGLVGLADPERQGVAALLAQFDRARVRVIMVTGDQGTTAQAVAQNLNLSDGAPIDMVEFDRLRHARDREISDFAHRARIFARVTPTDKLRIVQALQSTGKVVAMTGDGINDGPALRAADVGIVMGRSGTEVARQVADIVLQADDLATIAVALERGRTTYSNIRKAIHFLLATNLSEILVMLTATAAGGGALLTPIQLLWINLMTDVLPGLGLALEPAEPGVLEQPPRDPHEPILSNREMRILAREGVIIAAGGLAAYGYGLLRYGPSARAGTLSFTSLVGAQLLHALSSRSTRHGLFSNGSLAPNRPLFFALLGSAGLQLGIQTVPVLRRFMGLAPLSLFDAVVCAAAAVLPYLANEAAKAAALETADRPG